MSNPSKDEEGFAIPQPPAKRQHKPSEEVKTTTEIYGEKHGIPSDLQARLANVGRIGRQNVAMGHATQRAFERTQSFPSHVLNNSALPNAGFHTALDAFAHAQGIIHKEALRARELQPFYSASGSENRDVDGLSLSPRGANRKLKFNENGEVEEEMDGPLFPASSSSAAKEQYHLTSARKRRSSPAEPTSDTETEVGEDDEDRPAFTGPVPNADPATDFPPVFQSPALTHPELFGPTGSTSRALPSAFKGVNARQLRGLPGARKLGFGKTMSAPVGSLGSGSWGMDVDGDEQAPAGEGEEDGFDIKEWADSEQF